jgi:hypothetical protein
MSKLNEQVAALEERLKQLKAKQQKVDARKRAFESRQARKNDTRRKILAGAIVLAKVEQGGRAIPEVAGRGADARRRSRAIWSSIGGQEPNGSATMTP